MYPNIVTPKPKKIPVYAWGRKKPVGIVVGDEFRKPIKESGYLREPPAICIDSKSLENAEMNGARWVVITDKDDGRIHRAAIAKIKRDGFELDRGFGLQRGLLLSEWDTTEPKPEPTQLGFFNTKGRAMKTEKATMKDYNGQNLEVEIRSNNATFREQCTVCGEGHKSADVPYWIFTTGTRRGALCYRCASDSGLLEEVEHKNAKKHKKWAKEAKEWEKVQLMETPKIESRFYKRARKEAKKLWGKRYTITLVVSEYSDKYQHLPMQILRAGVDEEFTQPMMKALGWEPDDEHYLYEEAAISDTFSELEKELIVTYLKIFPNDEIKVTKAKMPPIISGNIEDAEIWYPDDILGGDTWRDWYMFYKHDGYPFTFKIHGYYDIRQAKSWKDAYEPPF